MGCYPQFELNMEVIKGNIWDYVAAGYIVIPTNGVVKKNGENVMGAGLAKQVNEMYPETAKLLGELIIEYGNNSYLLGVGVLRGFYSFPVKHHWRQKADLTLIEESTKQLAHHVDRLRRSAGVHAQIFLPKVGCGNGKLNWSDVEPILDKYLDDKFVVVDFK